MVRKGIFYVLARLIPDSFFSFSEIKKISPEHDSSDFYFIQIGANDGKSFDPIHGYVVKYGWKGILVEPVGCYFRKLKETYKGNKGLVLENVAISAEDGDRTIFRISQDTRFMPKWFHGMASFSKKTLMTHRFLFPDMEKHLIKEKVKCMTLKRLVEKHHVRKISLLCIDTEGNEYEVIRQLKDISIKPDVIFYEHKHLSRKEKKGCIDFLQRRGYKTIEKLQDSIAYLD